MKRPSYSDYRSDGHDPLTSFTLSVPAIYFIAAGAAAGFVTDVLMRVFNG